MILVVVICHNYGRFLRKCVLSIIKTDNKFLKEIIIVDDSNSDITETISNELQKKY